MKVNDIEAQRAIELLKKDGVNPASTFRAAAGESYGFVRAWKLTLVDWVVSVGNEENMRYFFTSCVDNLGSFLVKETETYMDERVQAANIWGIADIEEAMGGDDPPFYILETRFFSSDIERTELVNEKVSDEIGDELIIFGTLTAAIDWVVEHKVTLKESDYRRGERPRLYTIITDYRTERECRQGDE